MSIIGRLIQIGRAYFQFGGKASEEEIRRWEEELRQAQKKKSAEQEMVPKEIIQAFHTLEVDVGARFEVCKAAYRTLANKYHPDRWYEEGREKKENAEKLFKLINEAFIKIKKFYNIT